MKLQRIIVQSGIILTCLALGFAIRVWRQQTHDSAPSEAQGKSENGSIQPNKSSVTTVTPISLTTISNSDRQKIQNSIQSPLTLPDERSTLVYQLFSGVTNASEAKALFELMLKDPMATDRQSNHAVEALTLWGKFDPAAALAAASKIGYYEVRDDAVEAVLRDWAKRDFAAALAHMKTQTGGPSASNGPRILSTLLAEAEPRHAMETLIAEGWVSHFDNRRGPTFRVFQKWLGTDPEAAWEFVLARQAGERSNLLGLLAEAGASVDAQATWKRLLLPETKASDLAIQGVISFWRNIDPVPAVKAITTLPAGHLQQQMLMESGMALGTSHYVEQLLPTLPAGPPKEAFLTGSVQAAVASQDWAKAAEISTQISHPELHTTALRALSEDWPAKDVVAAAEWVAKQPPSLGRDLMARSLARTLIKEDPEAALTWAASMRDETRRTNVVRELWPQWHKAAPESAEAWKAQVGGELGQ